MDMSTAAMSAHCQHLFTSACRRGRTSRASHRLARLADGLDSKRLSQASANVAFEVGNDVGRPHAAGLVVLLSNAQAVDPNNLPASRRLPS